MTQPTFSLVSLGCPRNRVDSENMVQELQHAGLTLVQEGTGEPITVINSCAFIQPAIDETEANILHFIDQKKSGKLKYLVITGCYPGRFDKADLTKKFPEVDLWISTKEASRIKQEISRLVFQRAFHSHEARYTKITPSHYAYIKISEGCNNGCSYCTIPKIRGKHASRPLKQILDDCKKQLGFGAKELILVAEDTTAWGIDLYNKPSLPLLLSEVAALSEAWIRLMYVHPARVDAELIHTLANTPTICRYLDMPIQHTETDLLTAMHRKHDQAHLTQVLAQLRDALPDLALRTTLIVGFPGETQAHIDALIAYLTDHPFDHIGCFGYSDETGTRAHRLDGKVSDAAIDDRIHQVMTKQMAQVAVRNRSRLGETVTVLYEGDGIARSYREAPEVDSVIRVSNADTCPPGQFYSLTITGVDGYDLVGEFV